MKERLFRFKQFSVSHSVSAMKVGVDGVLIGAWAAVGESRVILDAGAGCGLIALMCAQRNPSAAVDAVEIEPGAAGEARSNFAASPWPERLRLIEDDIMNLPQTVKYDHVVSNPPFFEAGVNEINTGRELARHAADFSPSALVKLAPSILSPSGRLSLILPAENFDALQHVADSAGLLLSRLCRVRGHANAPLKRVMVEFTLPDSESMPLNPEITELTLETSPGNPTPEYRALCRDFYLKF